MEIFIGKFYNFFKLIISFQLLLLNFEFLDF